ncbi:EamA family transporter [Granulosicoccus antarcticus]|uniref:Putative amino-acid metabolite efflux pump n=1 Tax=Granulosicoccus antarcticus IMCC3135 TaxID=1192854 RepID=A0A2Z2P0K0_9GAMM|nr:EamA family transporter [Granulosicoccus antarcticus]ASJ75831.1 putative amino-acid metabolite efflux pump [Granulosicoccus antarcticus IMCC3135]
MPNTHRLLALLVAAIWGVNFLAIHASLEQYPPFFLAALRWTLIAIPTLLFIPRPQVPVRYLLGYGIGFGVLQFFFLYWGMAAGMPPGLASLVLQCSAPFTVILAALFTGELLGRTRVVGLALAVAGLTVVGSQRAGVDELWPFTLVILGGLGWAFGNLASRAAKPANPLQFTLWMSVVPPLPMLVLAAMWEGTDRIGQSLLTTFDAPWAIAGLVYTCVIATVAGSGIWTWLLSRYPASAVAPFSMMVPVFGLGSAAVVLGERINAIEFAGCLMILLGVVVASFSIKAVKFAPVAVVPAAEGQAR